MTGVTWPMISDRGARRARPVWGVAFAQEGLGPYNFVLAVGGIAQLGERLHGMQEVSGSIPLTSTIPPVVFVVFVFDLRQVPIV